MESTPVNNAASVILLVVSQLFWLFLIFGFFIIAVIKRKRQIGRRWEHPLSAKVKIQDVQLTCRHCNGDHFHKREALISTTLVSFFNFDYFNQSGAAYACVKCGHLHWFSRPQETAVEFTRDRE